MAMKSERKLYVFYSFRQFFHILTIFTWKNFRNSDQQLVRANVAVAILTALLLFGLFTAIMGTVWHCVCFKFDLSKTALPFALMFTATQMSITYITMGVKYKQLADVIADLVEKIDKRCQLSAKSFARYSQLEKRIAWITVFSIKISVFINVSLFSVAAVAPVLYLLIDYPQPDKWRTPYELRLPLPKDMNVFTRYYIDWINQCLSNIEFYVMLCTIALFLIGMCLYITEMVNDLQATLHDLKGNTHRITRGIMNEIKFHRAIIEIAQAVAEIISIGLFFQLLVCAVTIAVYMIGIESNLHLNMNFGVLCIGIAVTLSSTALYCYLSESITAALDSVYEVFYEYPWYQLLPKQQKLFLLPIQRAQKTYRFTGMGLVECSLSVYSSIIRAAWSYFLLMHRLS